MLAELGIPHRHQNLPPHSAETLAYSFSSKVPILLAGDVAILGSFAVLTYLADKHGQLAAQSATI